MRYILYARKSSESEDRQIQSIDDQLRILRELATRQGISIVEEILESRSAKAPGVRAEFAKMLRLIEKGKADAILCWSVNRLSRNPVDSGLLSWMLQTGGLKCIQTPERVYLPEDNVLLFAVETGVANQFILDLKKAVHRGMQSKIEKGWFPHRAPEGYDNDLRERTIIIDPIRFPLLQRAWRLLLDERKSIGDALDALNNEWGYQTRPSKRAPSGPMHRSMAYRIFTNPFYAGYFESSGQNHKGLHPPMVTLEEFRQVQLHLRGQLGKRHKGKRGFSYTGLIACSRCGRKLVAEAQRGHLKRGNWVYYHCGNIKGTCDKRSIREDILEQRLNACLEAIAINPEFKRIVMDNLEEWVKLEFGSQQTLHEIQLKSVAENECLQNELFEMRLRQLIDDEQFRAKQIELRTENARLRERVIDIEARVNGVRRAIENAMNFRLHARDEFMVGDAGKRRAIAQSLGVRYVYDKGDVAIELHPLLAYHCTPQRRAIEPPETGSNRDKQGDLEPMFSCGIDTEQDNEPQNSELISDSELHSLFSKAIEESFQFYPLLRLSDV